MKKRINIGVYAHILQVKKAYPFDFALLIMRLFTFSYTIGTITMLTLAGYAYFQAGSVASVLAISGLVFGPLVSRAIDRMGQARVLRWSCTVVILGAVLMIGNVLLEGPFALMYMGAVLMGFTAIPGALARTRWTYLLETDAEIGQAVELRSVYAYETILDDLGFTAGPPLSVAIAAAITPIAGMIFSTLCYLAGAIILIRSKETEPSVGWGVEPKQVTAEHAKSVFLQSPLVRILFFTMLCVGAFFGVFDTTTLALAEQNDQTTLASAFFTISGIFSMVSGFVFGTIRFKMNKAKLLIATGILLGVTYATMLFIDSIPTLFIFGLLASGFYAPYLISENTAVEHAVSPANLTEALTWIVMGTTCGMAFGPTLAGYLLDEFGVSVAYSYGAVFAICIPIIVLLFRKTIHRDVQ